MEHTNNWDEFYNEPIAENSQQSSESEDKLDPPKVLTSEQLSDFLSRISGKHPDGSAKSLITYKSYNFDGFEDDPDRDRIIYADNAYINVYLHNSIGNMYVVDIIFPSATDLQLKHMWNDLTKHMEDETKYPDNRWIFYINVLEKQSVSDMNNYEECALTANILNPVIFFLTRQQPDMLCDDKMQNGHLQGGNMIRMIVPNELLTFSVSDPQLINEAKREVLTQLSETEQE